MANRMDHPEIRNCFNEKAIISASKPLEIKIEPWFYNRKAVFPFMGNRTPLILKAEMPFGIQFIILESFRFVSKMLAGIGIAEFIH